MKRMGEELETVWLMFECDNHGAQLDQICRHEATPGTLYCIDKARNAIAKAEGR